MKLPQWVRTLLTVAGVLSPVIVVPFLVYWYAPHPWDHVACIVLGCLAVGAFVAMSESDARGAA